MLSRLRVRRFIISLAAVSFLALAVYANLPASAHSPSASLDRPPAPRAVRDLSTMPGVHAVLYGKTIPMSQTRGLACTDKLAPEFTCFRTAKELWEFIGEPDPRTTLNTPKGAPDRAAQPSTGAAPSSTDAAAGGYYVAMYPAINYSGGPTALYNAVSDFRTINYNDILSSYIPASLKCAYFYAAINYNNNTTGYPSWGGYYAEPDLRDYGGHNYNDIASSSAPCN
jgi:hypothetical protein